MRLQPDFIQEFCSWRFQSNLVAVARHR